MKNIALIGFMGSGKSTVGKVLSKRLGYSYTDTDKLIERRTRKTIPEIFEDDGEDKFRQIESAILDEALAQSEAVVSCGGGIVKLERNRTMLKEKAIVVYLKTDPKEVFLRVGRSGHTRPLLNANDPEAEINRLLKEREPLYKEVADKVVDTTGKSLEEVVDLILEALEAEGLKV